MITYRLAASGDTVQLANMRWDFRLEENPGPTLNDHETFVGACSKFLHVGLASARWFVWIALDGDSILSHIYIQRIDKMPKPNRINDFYGYVTNVYTRPNYRGQGIGAQLMAEMLQWAREQEFENLIVWPSETSVNWYRRAGFVDDIEMLTLDIRPYVL